MCPNCGCGWKLKKKHAKNWDGFIQNWQSTGCCLRKTATFVVESWYIVQMSRISCKSNWSRGPISQVCCVRMCGICTSIFSKKSTKCSRTTYRNIPIKGSNMGYYISSQWWLCSIFNKEDESWGFVKKHPKGSVMWRPLKDNVNLPLLVTY